MKIWLKEGIESTFAGSVWRVFPVGTGRRLRNGRVALPAIRVRFPCPPPASRPQDLICNSRCATIITSSQAASGLMDTPICKGSRLVIWSLCVVKTLFRPHQQVGSSNAKRPHPEGEAAFLLKSEPYCLTTAKTITRVKRVSDSMKARPSTRKSMIPARAPGLRASASVAEAVARP